MNRRNLLAGAAASLGLAGCMRTTLDNFAPRSLAFDAGSPLALVIVGIRPEPGKPLGLVPPDLETAWVRADAAQKDQRNALISAWTGYGPETRATNVHLVTPGRWVLHAVTVIIPNNRRTMSTHDNRRGLGFEVKPGEIVFVGDMFIDPTASPVAYTRRDPPDSPEIAVLAGYPNVKGTPRRVRLEPMDISFPGRPQ
jgi:hypothetical protein